MKCAGCVWACTTTAEIYGGLVQRSFFWVFSEFCIWMTAASLTRSCWWWPAARTPGRESSCTAPRRRRACPASGGDSAGGGRKRLSPGPEFTSKKLAGRAPTAIKGTQKVFFSEFFSSTLVLLRGTVVLSLHNASYFLLTAFGRYDTPFCFTIIEAIFLMRLPLLTCIDANVRAAHMTYIMISFNFFTTRASQPCDRKQTNQRSRSLSVNATHVNGCSAA